MAICQQAVRQVKPNREDKEMRRQRRHRKATQEDEVTLKRNGLSPSSIDDLCTHEHNTVMQRRKMLHTAQRQLSTKR